ncbi:transcriptional regulator [Mesorhizobium sp. L-8-10]|uniref:MarR family winged helix-turn-helix transcriptional regulator n=1 Tax=unclassified Mesorhizobium TaxID=325217 RepID=UPI0019284669|nr:MULTISPECIES: MarR family winged helix-turn-helix transcriptional regulator [unclassified Mesorhizobium]BCH26547.1 transcriptional regulator [Mesorhizobium sp. L-8-3]BCH34532.1 transcriptional regulator [Mesorhizobium sp. L-8-10]
MSDHGTIEQRPTSRDSSAPRLDPLPSFVGYMLRRAQLMVFEDFIGTMAAVGLRPASFSVLCVVNANPGLTQTAVSEALGLQRTNLVPIIDTLEKRGLARREPALNDRRSHALFLTDAGERLLAEAMGLQAEHESRVLARLQPKERDQLLHLLHSMLGDGGA